MKCYLFIKFKANTDYVATKTDVVIQSVLKGEKGRSRDKSNSSKRKMSRHLNT